MLGSLAAGPSASTGRAQEPDTEPASQPAAAADKSVEQLVESVRKSVVVITFTGRDGRREGLGTGFVVAPDGLIATNLHVIGEARPITVQTADGKRFEVTSVHASDRPNDLALIRIDANDLAPLELGDSDALKQGQPVVALGNPHGLAHSVVTGVVSGQPEIDGRRWIQLAIPIEPGNSGGPLLDLQGRVHGLLTMKSLLTANLGFAVPVNRLKPLLEKPNPIAIDRWLTIGTLDPREWTPLFGARWRRAGGRIAVDGLGSGFAGRSLCLSQLDVPDAPYEVSVAVKLDQEAGAAGLAFAADGGDNHHGFYPTAGKLRLTRFNGPDVTSWQVLYDQSSPHYRLGDWNILKVRVEPDKVICFVNDHTVCEVPASLAAGRVGLAKFRTTQAEFKQFRLGRDLPSTSPPPEVVARINQRVEGISTDGPPEQSLVDELVSGDPSTVVILRDRAQQLQRQAEQLRHLARAVHHERVLAELAKALEPDEGQIDLFHAALLIARLDNDDLDVAAYRQELARMAAELTERIPAEADEAARLAALNEYLFETCGFHGSRGDYYNSSNSYVNEVLDDREGLPITLSVVYIELAGRINVGIEGVGLPGHFVVRHRPADQPAVLIDVYERGQPLSEEEAGLKVQAFAGRPPAPGDLEAVGKRAILVRILHNLRGIAVR
ncbi:MAG: transglutaminase family protein, partial [Pirellulales bacterium]